MSDERREHDEAAVDAETNEAEEDASGRNGSTEETPPPAEFPPGFWRRADYLLHHTREVEASLRHGESLWGLCLIMLWATMAMAAIYGLCMGATNLLQGSEMPLSAKLLYPVSSAVKVPALFLLALAIVLPPIYISNAFMGYRLTFQQVLAGFLVAAAVSATVLASTATVVVFFALTSTSYDFLKLLHVLFFAYAGLTGIAVLYRTLTRPDPGGAPQGSLLLAGWIVLYMFVGAQLAWVMRPFIGDPGAPFTLFRERQGNFYVSVYEALARFLYGL